MDAFVALKQASGFAGAQDPQYTVILIFTVLIRLAIITVTVIRAVILVMTSAIHAVTVIHPCLGRPW